MAFTIKELALPTGDPIYYDPSFRSVIEAHLPILRTPGIVRAQAISPTRVHQFEGNFYGLLSHLKIPLQYHWIIMRINGFNSPSEFGMSVHDPYEKNQEFALMIPSEEFLRNLRMLHLSVQN